MLLDLNKFTVMFKFTFAKNDVNILLLTIYFFQIFFPDYLVFAALPQVN